mgnify:CR=1 FL=1
MAQLFLSGGGNKEQSRKLDRLLVSLIPRNKRMIILFKTERGII